MATLINLLANTKGATICTLVTATIPTMRKTANPFIGRVKKIVKGQMQFGYDYENAVNNRLKAQGLEPNFSAQSRKWGKWIIPNKVAENNGEYYLRFYTITNNTKTEVVWLIDGRVATESEVEQIKSFIPAKSSSNTQAQAGLTEHQVEPREYKASSIIGITINGETYKVTESQELAVALA